MTAEIAILNREAIALAADSAVTYRDQSGEKIFPSANKIFTLSKFRPVGVMIYGGAEFMGVPWETVIKVFRAQLGNREYGCLSEYADAFFDFLSTDRRFSPASRQYRYVELVLSGYLSALRDAVRAGMQEEVDAKGEITQDRAKQLLKDRIESTHREWKEVEFPSPESNDLVAKVREDFKDLIIEKKKEFFPKHLTSVSSRWLTALAVWWLAKGPAHESAPYTTGLVIAGFGEEEIFPSFHAFAVSGVVCDVVQVRKLHNKAVTRDERAVVAPFAQKEMVQTFMEGVDPDYAEAISQSFSDIVMSLPRVILEDIESLGADERGAAVKKFRSVAKRLLAQYRSALNDYRSQVHVAPIVRAIGVLPKNELAAVAESLVNITAFKRRVSMDAETVGGPIDVAVISRGDGFVWIKRKHYFKPELNHQFLQRYFDLPEGDDV